MAGGIIGGDPWGGPKESLELSRERQQELLEHVLLRLRLGAFNQVEDWRADFGYRFISFWVKNESVSFRDSDIMTVEFYGRRVVKMRYRNYATKFRVPFLRLFRMHDNRAETHRKILHSFKQHEEDRGPKEPQIVKRMFRGIAQGEVPLLDSLEHSMQELERNSARRVPAQRR